MLRAEFEKVGRTGREVFLVRENWGAGFGCPYHFHPEAELTAIVGGRGRRLVGDHLAEFHEGDLVLLGPDLPHQYVDGPGPARRGPRWAGSLVVQFPEDMLGGVVGRAAEFEGIRKLMERARRGLFFQGARARRVVEAMGALARTEGAKRVTRFLDILADLAEDERAAPLASERYRPVLKTRQSARMDRISGFIQERLAEDLSQAAAARHAGMSAAAFSRFFRRVTGRTFGGFVNALRVGEACRMLIETDEPVGSIAYASGFKNLSNFNRRFLALRGVTPREFRARVSEGREREGRLPRRG